MVKVNQKFQGRNSIRLCPPCRREASITLSFTAPLTAGENSFFAGRFFKERNSTQNKAVFQQICYAG